MATQPLSTKSKLLIDAAEAESAFAELAQDQRDLLQVVLDAAEGMTARGWPRPIIDGYPIPWIAPPSDLKKVNAKRMMEVLLKKTCQVCGEPHQGPGATVYFCSASEENINPATGYEDYKGDPPYLLNPIDNALMHERCARLATKSCPRLRDELASGGALVYSAPLEKFTMVEGLNIFVVEWKNSEEVKW